jgi:serine/threonine-protein kinase
VPDAGEPTFLPVKGSEVLDGKWKLERKIGEGGMGAVYLAHDLQLDRKVAIKILASSLAHDAELVARFEREARFTASLEHPNIVPIYAVGRFKNRPFMVMKYLEGQPLSALLRSQSVLQLDQVLALTRQVCNGLEFIHAKGYVHRDIKAGNIFVGPNGLATILDFGILRPKRNAESLTRTGMVMGTPQYMSPEQALGEKEIDHRSDLYALAVVIYECLAGTLPFDSDSDLSIIQMQAHAPAPDICQRANWISRPVGDLVMRALAKRPQDRFQSAGELASAFEAAVALQDMFQDSSAASINLPSMPDPPIQIQSQAPAAAAPPGSRSPPTAASARMSGPKIAATATVAVRLTPVSAPGMARPSGSRVAAAVKPEDLDAVLAPPAPVHPHPQAPAVAPPAPASPPPVLDAGPRLNMGPSTNEYAQAVRRRRGPMVAVAAVLAVLGLGVAYLAVKPRLAPAAGPVEGEGALASASPVPVPPLPLAPPAETATSTEPGSTTAPAEEEEPGVEEGDEASEPVTSTAPGTTPAPTPTTPGPRPSLRRTAPPPPSIPGGMGRVNVVTTFKGGPFWASIRVNGESKGTTPVLLELPAGKHQIRVERAGFKAIEKQIKVASGRSAVLRLELTP